MTIESRVTYLAGLIKRKPREVPLGTEMILKKPDTLESNWYTISREARRAIGIVRSPNKVIIRYNDRHNSDFHVDFRYENQGINKVNLHEVPSLKDLFLGRRTRYYWKP